ncbi:helix-turn-helix domain-containing protein, partial [Rubrimonas sp.]|uniref:helix-turn-helix domain-containing protein n=1 Tax=Rubrimonas sp. TaxID=2036015 RepID=UPI002FDD0D60
EARLAAFLADVADGTRDAMALIDDLAAWRARAEAAAAAMKGATPARAVALLAQRPAVSAPAAAGALGLSDDAALRVLMRLERAGLAREITGQGRFRVWAARL